MTLSKELDRLHAQARKNRWLQYFAVFNRIALAAGFLPSGLQKVLGERFTVLSPNHPMGNFLEAFYHTGYYYTFVGLMQVAAALLLLIPRTATLGAFIYLPIILNICILSLSVRFDGSLLTSPLMLCAVLYLLCWDYHKFRDIFPFNYQKSKSHLPDKRAYSSKFPTAFFVGVALVVALAAAQASIFYEILPKNTITDCKRQCEGQGSVEACVAFCECIHEEGRSLRICLDEFAKWK